MHISITKVIVILTMYSQWLSVIICAATILTVETTFEACLKKDSISCIQTEIYKQIKSLTRNASIDLFNGTVKINAEQNVNQTPLQLNTERSFEGAIGVENRQKALEAYFLGTIENLAKQRRIMWNWTKVMKLIVNALPNTLTKQLTFVSEGGRGKKKQMKMILPILIAAKLVFFMLTSAAYVVIALVAKKALLAGLLSLALGGFETITNLVNTKPAVHAAEIMGYQAINDWQPSISGEDQDLVGSYSEPAPQHQLFIGHETG